MKTDTSRHDKPPRWHVERPYGEEGTYITEDSTALIAKVYPRGYPSSNLTQAEKLEQQQRAALIAAAPELLEALKSIIEWQDCEVMPEPHKFMMIRNAARAAITKATYTY